MRCQLAFYLLTDRFLPANLREFLAPEHGRGVKFHHFYLLIRAPLFAPLLQDASYEASMPFSIRAYRRVSVYCPVTYHAGLRKDHGIIWNLSLTGWRLSGDLPLQVGHTCPLTVYLPASG